MSKRRVIVRVLLAALLVGGVAAWLAGGGQGPTPENSHSLRDLPTGSAPAEAPPPATLSARDPAFRPTVKGPKQALRVRVVCDDPAVPAKATIGLRGISRRGRHDLPVVTAVPGADGVAVIDVQSLVAAGHFHTLEVEVAHPDCPTASAQVGIPGAEMEDVVPAEFLREVEVRLVRGCMVEGAVVLPDGKPAAGSAVQAVYAEDTGPNGARTFGEGVVTGPDGRFRLLVGGAGSALVVAGKRDWKPTAVPVEIVSGKRVDAGTLRISPGATLAGRVKCGGVPKEKITVIATWYGTKKEGTRPAGDGRLWVEDGRAIWSQVETHPDDEGKFRLSGLENGPYRLRVPAEDWGCALHPDAYAQVDSLMHAPDEHVQVDADRSLMVIEVADGDHLVQSAIVTLDGRDQIRLDSNTNGEVGVVLRASQRHRVTIEAPNYATATLEVTAAEPGIQRRERVALAALPEGAPRTVPPWDVHFHFELMSVGCEARGPDGVLLAARARLVDASGATVPCRFVDQRPVVQVVSVERLGVGGRTMVVTAGARRDLMLEVGGQGLELKRFPWDGESAVVAVLHPR